MTNTLDTSNVVIEFSWNQEWIVDIRKKKTQEGTLSAAVSPGVVEPKAGVSQGQEKQLHLEHNLQEAFTRTQLVGPKMVVGTDVLATSGGRHFRATLFKFQKKNINCKAV